MVIIIYFFLGSLTHQCVQAIRGSFSSMAFGLSDQNLIPLNLNMIFFLVSAWSRALSTHPVKAILFGSMQFLLTIVVFLSFLKKILKGFKQATSKG
jgi:hypothetical protein